jgi:hypothetical protein
MDQFWRMILQHLFKVKKMANFNNCRIGIFATNLSSIKLKNATLIKDALDTGIILKNSSSLVHMGLSGSTGSSFNILTSKRGIQLQNSSRVTIENASIKGVQYGFICTNSSSFDFNKSQILGDTYSSFTGQAYGMYVTDRSTGNIFESSITGYFGGTASLTSGNMAVVKNATLFLGTTADSLRVNIAGLGNSLPGAVFVDSNLGKKISSGDALISPAVDPEP